MKSITITNIQMGLGSTLKCGFGVEFENETDEVDVIVDFGGVVKW